MVFKAGRDSCVLTDRQLLSIDVQGFSGKRVAYISIPYASTRAYAVESAVSFDRDVELKIFTHIYWELATFSQDFRKGKAYILAIQTFLSCMILRDGKASSPGAVGEVSGFLDWLGSDVHEIDAAAVQQRLHHEMQILQADETVNAAFKCGRYMFVHTNKRVMFVDVQGRSGKKVEYLSVPLRFCTGFKIKTAGKFDRDSELRIYTDWAVGRLNQDLRKGKANVEH
eukprot:105237-Rhodomonas_salina.1